MNYLITGYLMSVIIWSFCICNGAMIFEIYLYIVHCSYFTYFSIFPRIKPEFMETTVECDYVCEKKLLYHSVTKCLVRYVK